MAFSSRFFTILCALLLLSSHGLLADSSLCPRLGLDSFMLDIRSQCPVWLERTYPQEVSGEMLEKELEYAQDGAYYSIFFYASWCPFSRTVRPNFNALSSMFPQIKHIAVEESSAMPSVFSRYGVRSFPSILIANKTRKMPYRGRKDLDSLVKFYKQATGVDPVAYFQIQSPPNSENRMPISLWDRSLREILSSEPYVAFSVAFICLRALVCFFPVIISRIKTFLVVYTLHLNLGIFGEWNHLLERVIHVIDLKKLWSKLCRLCNKTRNIQKGATNARVWASSLASVSLGESSSSRNLK